MESWLPRWNSPDPSCPGCGRILHRLISAFAIALSGDFQERHNDPTCQGSGETSHIAYRVRSSRSGKPEPVVIDSFQKQREFCRDEGLVNPKELPSSMPVGADGKTVANTVGTPGCWI